MGEHAFVFRSMLCFSEGFFPPNEETEEPDPTKYPVIIKEYVSVMSGITKTMSSFLFQPPEGVR